MFVNCRVVLLLRSSHNNHFTLCLFASKNFSSLGCSSHKCNAYSIYSCAHNKQLLNHLYFQHLYIYTGNLIQAPLLAVCKFGIEQQIPTYYYIISDQVEGLIKIDTMHTRQFNWKFIHVSIWNWYEAVLHPSSKLFICK